MAAATGVRCCHVAFVSRSELFALSLKHGLECSAVPTAPRQCQREIFKIQLHERPDAFCLVSVKILHLENELVRILVRTPTQVSLVHFYSKSFDSEGVLRVAVVQPLSTSLEVS